MESRVHILGRESGYYWFLDATVGDGAGVRLPPPTELARRLGGLHPAIVYRLRRLPDAPPLEQVEAWRDFAIRNLTSPDAIVKHCR